MASRDARAGPFVGRCCWCGDPADSAEDIISKWIEKEIAPPPAQVVGPPTLRQFDHGRVRRWEVQRLATKKARVRAVCQRCNNTWMSAQERVVQPILAPLIRGHRRLLPLEHQLEVAFWACIKSVICDARPRSGDGGLASEATRRSIFVERRPPDDLMVRVAAYEAAYDVAVLNLSGHGQGSEHQPLAQWATTIVAGHLVVQVLGRTGSSRPHVLDQLMGGVHDRKSFTVWPPRPSSTEWPPPQVLTVEMLPGFSAELVPELNISDEAFQEEINNCPRCGARHGPHIRALPVAETAP